MYSSIAGRCKQHQYKQQRKVISTGTMSSSNAFVCGETTEIKSKQTVRNFMIDFRHKYFEFQTNRNVCSVPLKLETRMIVQTKQ